MCVSLNVLAGANAAGAARHRRKQPQPKWEMDMGKWTYCNCAGSHKPGCPNGVPGGLPPLKDDDDKKKGK